MARRDRTHALGFWYRWLPVVLVCALFGGAAASYRYSLGERWLGIQPSDPVDNPGAVAPPKGLDLPGGTAAAPVAAPVTTATAGAVDPVKVRRALAPLLQDPKLGRHVLAQVGNLTSSSPVFQQGAATVIPASTMKLLTGTAALAALGGGTTFETTVVRAPGSREIVLVGGGDPYLASEPPAPEDQDELYPRRADVGTLARQTAAALKRAGLRSVRLGYDDTLFAGPSVSPQWPRDYVTGMVVSRISALWVDGGDDPTGWGNVADPSLAAAQVFRKHLTRFGIGVSGAPRATIAPAGAARLAAVESAPVEQIVQRVIDISDNEGAEVLAHHVGLAVTGEGSFDGGRRGVVQTLRKLGVPLADDIVYDGSGLARTNRVAGETLLDVLRLAASDAHPELRPVLEGLPVAGFTGSLSDRFDKGAPAGRGRVRAKTGTLTGVHGLAGVATDLQGNVMVFALVADRVKEVDTLDARAALDEAAAALGACRCGA